MFLLFLCLPGIVHADLRMGSRPRDYYYLRQEKGSVKWTGFNNLHYHYMEPAVFGYKGLTNQKNRNYDNFLRSNIDNEQDNRNFNDEIGRDHLPFRTWEGQVNDSYTIYPGNRNGYYQRPFQIGLTKVLQPGESVLVPFRWNNPHASEMEVNIWIFDHASKHPVVIPIRKPSCSGEGHQDNVISFTVPADFSTLGSKIPGFQGCGEESKPMCTLQVYSHSVESRTYAIGFPIVIPGHDKSLTTTSSDGIQAASKDPWLDLSGLRDLCLPATDPSNTISSAIPRWARLVSDVFNHAYQNSDYSPYSGQQHESISKNLQASAINKMETGNRGELGRSILTVEASNRLSSLRKLEDRIYKNYESLANKIIKSIGGKMANTGKIGDQALATCFRCSEVGSTVAKRLQTNTYIPSFQLPKELEKAARELVLPKYAGLFSKTGQVQIYVAALSDLLPFFYKSRYMGITYQEAVVKTTLITMSDAMQFKKRNKKGITDGGVYAATMAKQSFATSRGCPGECLYAEPQLPSGAQCDETLSGSKGSGYRGCQMKTKSGLTCQSWSSQTPHKHSRTPSKRPGSGLVFNYCRNPDGEKTIWCYTTDPEKRWEYCDPISPAAPSPTPTETPSPSPCDETLSGTKQSGYRGCQSKTRSGFSCQPWSSQSPHRHSRTPAKYPGRGLISNYCRNPDGSKTIWCYTTDPKKRWEYCDPLIPTCLTTSSKLCVFPFIYKGVTYNACTKVGHSKKWCSTQTDANGKHVRGKWGICAASCEEEAAKKGPDNTAEKWFCVARASKTSVSGPYPDIEAAKKELNKSPGSKTNKQMICEMSKGGPKQDPHKVGGQNQGDGAKAGFSKWWANWDDIYHMNEMCTASDMCRFNGIMPEPDRSSWFCVAKANKKNVSGPYPDVASAKAELNKLSGHKGNRQMICEMTQGGAKADPHRVGGQNQGGGPASGFNRFWLNSADIKNLNGMCEASLHCKFNTKKDQVEKPLLIGSDATNVTGACTQCAQFFGKKVHIIKKPKVTPLAQRVSASHDVPPSQVNKTDRIPDNPDDFGLTSGSRRRRRATSFIQKKKGAEKKSKQHRHLKTVSNFMRAIDLREPDALNLEVLNDVRPL